MRVYQAKYDAKYNTADNSLVANLLKYPEIAKKVIELYPRYTTTYLLEKLNFGAGEKVLGDNSFEWKSMGRYRSQQQIHTAKDLDADVAAGAAISFNVKDDVQLSSSPGTFRCMIHKNDILRIGSYQFLVTSVTPGDGTTAYAVVATKALQKVISVADGTAGDEEFSAGDIVAIIGNAYGEGSSGDEVSQGYAYPETRKNWVTISRKKLVIDARDLTDITWVEHNGHRLWFFTKEQQTEAQFMYDLEVMRWFGKSSIAQYDATAPGSNATPLTGIPVIGDGIIEQIKGSNTYTYGASGATGATLSEETMLDFLGQLSLNAISATGNEYVVFTGTQGKIAFHKAMKDLLVPSSGVTGNAGATVLIDKFGQDVPVGANFSSYQALGNKLTLVHCPVFDDPNIATAPGYTAPNGSTYDNIDGNGFKGQTLSGLMVFLDMSSQNGVANIELIAKGAEGTNRNYVKKYVPGMINPYDSKSMLAATADDKFECHWLTQSGIIVRNPLSCGIIKPIGLAL